MPFSSTGTLGSGGPGADVPTVRQNSSVVRFKPHSKCPSRNTVTADRRVTADSPRQMKTTSRTGPAATCGGRRCSDWSGRRWRRSRWPCPNSHKSALACAFRALYRAVPAAAALRSCNSHQRSLSCRSRRLHDAKIQSWSMSHGAGAVALVGRAAGWQQGAVTAAAARSWRHKQS